MQAKRIMIINLLNFILNSVKYYFFILFSLCASQFNYCQVSEGDTLNVIKAINIKSSINQYIQYTENKDGSIDFNSILTREIKRTKYRNYDVFLITQKYQNSESVDVDSSFVNSKNLKPIAYHTDISSENLREKVEFFNNKISNTIISGDSVASSTIKNKQFYNGVMINDLIGELPLEMSKSFLIQLINPGKRHFEYTATVRVLGTDMVQLNSDSKIECWKLSITFGESKIGTIE